MSASADLPVAILAGGLATRMRPLTETVPKSMLEVAGVPFVDHQLRRLAQEGVSRAVMCVGYLGEQIRDHVGDGRRFGLQVDYSFDGPELRGTGGALRRALPLLGDAFFVLYGDSWLEVPYLPVATAFRRAGLPALMTVFRNLGQWDSSNVVFADGRIVCYDKRAKRPDMAHIDYGLGVVAAAALADEPDSFDLAALYTRLAAEGRLAGYEVFSRFYEIGTPAGLADTERHLKEAQMATPYTAAYYEEVVAVAKGIDQGQVDAIVEILARLRQGPGRLFMLGVGGSAGNCGHAVNDFRKICGIEAYAPTDNVSELTARTNDDGWTSVFANWLLGSRINAHDVVFVFSVGGGNAEKNISANLVEALKLAKHVGAKVVGVVGRDGGYTRQVADACVVVPTVNPATVTPHAEAFQAVVWHGIVTHPTLLANAMKWESTR